MNKERYLEQEINKDLKIQALERQLAEAREEQVRFLSMLLPYIHPSSTCEVYKSVCKRLAKLKEQG